MLTTLVTYREYDTDQTLAQELFYVLGIDPACVHVAPGFDPIQGVFALLLHDQPQLGRFCEDVTTFQEEGFSSLGLTLLPMGLRFQSLSRFVPCAADHHLTFETHPSRSMRHHLTLDGKRLDYHDFPDTSFLLSKSPLPYYGSPFVLAFLQGLFYRPLPYAFVLDRPYSLAFLLTLLAPRHNLVLFEAMRHLISTGILSENTLPSPTHLGPGPAWRPDPSPPFLEGQRLHETLAAAPPLLGDSAHAQLTQQALRAQLDTLAPCMTSIFT
jgi:hypothetical protein